jgi:hypothetical protein
VSAFARTDSIIHCFSLRRASSEDPGTKSFLFSPFRRDSFYGTGQRLYFVAVSFKRTDIYEPFRFTRYACTVPHRHCHPMLIGTPKLVTPRPPLTGIRPPQLASICYHLHLSRFSCAKWRTSRNLALRSRLRRIQTDRSVPCSKFGTNAGVLTQNTPKHIFETFCRTRARWLFVANEQLACSWHNSMLHVCGGEQSNSEQKVALAIEIISRWFFIHRCHCLAL